MQFGLEHGAGGVAHRRPAGLVGQVHGFGVIENLANCARQLDAALLASSRSREFPSASARSSCSPVKVARCLVIASSTAAGVARRRSRARNSFASSRRVLTMPPCSRS